MKIYDSEEQYQEEQARKAIADGLIELPKGDTGDKGERGEKGEKGENGKTPIKNVDYFDGKDGKTPVKGIDYFDGKDGKDGKDGNKITTKELVKKINTVENEIDYSVLKNVPDIVGTIQGSGILKRQGGGTAEILEDGNKVISSHRFNFGSGFDITAENGTAKIDLDLSEVPEFQDLQSVTDIGATTTNSLTALSFIKSGATSDDVLLGDGSTTSLAGISTDPAGSDTQIQFNNAGSFGASADLTWGANQLQVIGASTDLSATTVTNLTGAINGSGTGYASPYTDFNGEFSIKVTPFKIVGGVTYVYGTNTSSVVTYTAGTETEFNVGFTWDALAEADGYIIRRRYFIPAFGLVANAYDDGYEFVFTNSYVMNQLSRLTGGVLDTSNSTVNDVAVDTTGSININGDLFMADSKILSIGGDGGFAVGDGFVNNRAIDIQTGRTDTNNRATDEDCFTFGYDNKATLKSLAIGISNDTTGGAESAIAIGENNIVSGRGAISIGSNNVNTVLNGNTFIIGNDLAAANNGTYLGSGGSFSAVGSMISVVNKSGVGKFSTGVNGGSWGAELNSATIVEDMDNSLGSNIIENPTVLDSGTNWNFSSTECTQYTSTLVKDTNGTTAITPPSLLSSLVVGKRYGLFLQFLDDTTNIDPSFSGTISVTMGGATIGTISNFGSYWFTFTATAGTTLTLSPSDSSRFSLFNAFCYPIEGGDLNVLGDTVIGVNTVTPDTKLFSEGGALFNDNQNDSDFTINSENVADTFKVDASTDDVIVNGNFKITEKSSDPADPAEGESVIWMSDGTGSGDDGDIMVKITAGATTKTATLIDFSAI